MANYRYPWRLVSSNVDITQEHKQTLTVKSNVKGLKLSTLHFTGGFSPDNREWNLFASTIARTNQSG